MQRVIIDIKDQVAGGTSFADALNEHPKHFDDLYCDLVETGEHSGALETIYDRIHEVRMRFEVLLRDAHIRYLEQRHEQPDAEAVLAAQLAEERRELMADFVFVAECNVGGEFMDEKRLARLRSVGATTWTRYLDNRLGLSPAEELHLSRFPGETPAVETLLSDRPEHVFQDDMAQSRYAGLAFTMTPGEFKQNLGEIYNLSIGQLSRRNLYS